METENLKFKYHPLIDGLKVSSDGRLIYLNGKKIEPFQRKTTKGFMIIIGQRTHPVHKIVCETWHGPRETFEMSARHIDGDPENNDYRNLEWTLKQYLKNGEKEAGV